MIIKSKCKHCGYSLSVPQEFKGKNLRCPQCGEASAVEADEEKEEFSPEELSVESPSSPPESPPSLNTSSTPSTTPPPLRSLSLLPQEERKISPKVSQKLEEVSELSLFLAYFLPFLIFLSSLIPFFNHQWTLVFKIEVFLLFIIFAGLVFIALKTSSALLLWLADFEN